MKFEMEFNKNDKEAYQKFCVNYVNQIRDKLNFEIIDNKMSMDMIIIREKIKHVNPIRKEKPNWSVGKEITEKAVK